MAQTDLIRTHFCANELITSSVDSKKQLLSFTSFFKIGDRVDIYAIDADCCPIGSPLATDLIVEAIQKHISISFDVSVDTSTALPAGAVGWYAVAKEIDDGQEAIERLYRNFTNGKTPFGLCINITDFELNAPIAGQATYDVPDVSFWRAGDVAIIICDDGVAGEANVVSVNENADDINNSATIVLDSNIDLTTHTGCVLCNKNITMKDAIIRTKEDLDAVDKPIENEYIGIGDCDDVVFEADMLFLATTSKLFLDGRRLRLGTPGTRAELTNDVTDAQLILTSMILGLSGNKTEFEMLDPSALSSPLSISVTGSFNAGYTVSVSLETDGGGVIISTAQDVADALNADSDVKKILVAQYGGNGTGVQSALVATNLAGGLNDGTGDYAELEQVFENNIVNTGYKFVSLWILPNDNNRLNKPPRASEELTIDYRKALSNM